MLKNDFSLLIEAFLTLQQEHKQKEMEEIIENIENTIEDLVSDLLYYDRKEDENLPKGAIEKAIKEGKITEEQMVKKFAESLTKGLTM